MLEKPCVDSEFRWLAVASRSTVALVHETEATDLDRASLAAVIFDVDGTLVDSEGNGHLPAFNAAFADAGFGFRWSPDEYGELLAVTGGDRRIAHYLRSIGYDEQPAAELARSLHVRKTGIFTDFVRRGLVAPRPGVHRLLHELARGGVRIAVATTGRASWVQPLLETSLRGSRFEQIVTGDDVTALKPDPSAYLLAVARLGVPAPRVLAVEDSRNGLLAAAAAGVRCVVVSNDYTAGQRFSEAALVLDGFGEPGAPAQVQADPHGTGCRGLLDLTALRGLITDQ